MQINEHNTSYQQRGRQKPHDLLYRCRKTWSSSAWLHEEVAEQVRLKRNASQPGKGYIRQTHDSIMLRAEKQRAALRARVPGMPTFTMFSQQSVGSPGQSNQEMESHEGIQVGKTGIQFFTLFKTQFKLCVCVCDCVTTKTQPKTISTNKWVLQSCRMQKSTYKNQ